VFEHVEKRMDSSSSSSNCHVDTTTGNETESKPGWKGKNRNFVNGSVLTNLVTLFCIVICFLCVFPQFFWA